MGDSVIHDVILFPNLRSTFDKDPNQSTKLFPYKCIPGKFSDVKTVQKIFL